MSESSHSKNFLEKQSFSELKELDISVSSFDRFIPRKSIIVDAIFELELIVHYLERLNAH